MASPGHRDCMVGNNSASVVADAYIKGLRGYDIETLWEAVVLVLMLFTQPLALLDVKALTIIIA